MWVCALSDTQANSEISNTAENSAELFSWRPLTWCSTEVILFSLLPADDLLHVLASKRHYECVIRLHHAECMGTARTHLSLLQPGHWCQITCSLICIFKMYTSSIISLLCTQISTAHRHTCYKNACILGTWHTTNTLNVHKDLVHLIQHMLMYTNVSIPKLSELTCCPKAFKSLESSMIIPTFSHRLCIRSKLMMP